MKKRLLFSALFLSACSSQQPISPISTQTSEPRTISTSEMPQNDAEQDFSVAVPLSLSADGTYKELSLRLVDNGSPAIMPVNDKIGVVCIGMSNAKQECDDFIERQEQLLEMGKVNPQVRFVNCALGGHAVEVWNDPEYDRILWNACIQNKIPAAGLRPEEIRVVWHKAGDMYTADENGIVYPPYPDPDSNYFHFYENLTVFATRLHEKLPSVQAVYVSSRSYGGFAEQADRGEPHSYEEGLALNEWLRVNPSVDGVWYGWGAYLWGPACSTGETNANDVCYERNDYQEDGVHPDRGALNKISRVLHAYFLQFDWYAPK